MTIDPRRLVRAIREEFDVEHQPTGHRYRVLGPSSFNHVDLDAPARAVCTCLDHGIRGVECKHILAVRLSLGDREVVRALRDIVPPEVAA